MPSKLRAVLILAVLGVWPLHCDTRDDRIEDVCRTLSECSNYLDKGRCETELEDALEDDRITRTGLTRCGHCLGGHESSTFVRTDGAPTTASEDIRAGEDCADLIVDRDCDTACAEIDFALRVRTGPEMRNAMCGQVDESCGLQASGTCAKTLADLFGNADLEGALALDEHVEECFDCAQPAGESIPDPTVDAGQVGDAGDERAQQQLKAGLQERIDRCSSLIGTCSEACAQVPPVSNLLLDAAAMMTFCKIQGCLSGSTPALREAPDAGDAGVDAGKPLPDQVECYAALSGKIGAAQTEVRSCAACAQGSTDCEFIRLNCADSCGRVQP